VELVRLVSIGGIVTSNMLVSGLQTPVGADFPHPSRLAPGLTQPLIQWLLGFENVWVYSIYICVYIVYTYVCIYYIYMCVYIVYIPMIYREMQLSGTGSGTANRQRECRERFIGRNVIKLLFVGIMYCRRRKM
jgi:hypothetical protein